MKTKEQKQIDAIKKYLKNTRKKLDKCVDKDWEYNTSTGNGVNPCEASAFFEEVEENIDKILNEPSEIKTNET